jgi:hypothetical protein
MFLPDEIKFFETLSEDMLKRMADVNASSSATVACSKIGRICTRVLAEHAALDAKRNTRAGRVTKFQAARQARKDAKKGGTAQPQSQGQPQAQKRA